MLLGACSVQKEQAFVPPPAIHSFHDQTQGQPIRRVAILPIACDLPLESSLGELDAALREELGKTSLFELVPVSRETLATEFGRRQVSSVEVVPGDFLTKLRFAYGVDGVLFTDLTHYRPYRPIAIGLRSKLVDANTGQVRWAFEHLFDAGNAITANAAEHWYRAMTPPPPTKEHPRDGTAVLQSPSRFSKYVAEEAFRSLLDPPSLPN